MDIATTVIIENPVFEWAGLVFIAALIILFMGAWLSD